MDELEFRKMYNDTITAVEKLYTKDPATFLAVMNICQMLNYLDERITEMQEAEDC